MAPTTQRGTRNGRHWILTVPFHLWATYLPPGVTYIRGQLERGGSTGFEHWQIYVCFREKTSLRRVREVFGECHAELTRSEAARAYCWKEESRVDGTQFELGELPFRRNDPTDWAAVRLSAMGGDLGSVPDQIYVRHYNQLRRISQDHLQPMAMARLTSVYWGDTSTGKTRRAYWEAGDDCYFKCPSTKWWDGYRGQNHCIIDDYSGAFDFRSLLRWLDRYPVLVECKGGWLPLRVTQFWITSNLHPLRWYPQMDRESLDALLRRLTVQEEMVLPCWTPPAVTEIE